PKTHDWNRIPRKMRLACCAQLFAGCLAMLGCGGPRAADVSGKVTFNGQPIPAGKIYFNPDFTKSNDGAQGFADIHNGEFDTRKKGKGACGGPTIVSIEGFDGEGGGKPGAL